MNDVFGHGYAGVYDALYAEKDYDSENALLKRIFHEHTGAVCSVLDIGCGTGGHAIPLAVDGYDVVGIDRSADMLALARDKAIAEKADITWYQADARHLDIGRRFDAAIMMFAVLGYQIHNHDILAVLANVRQHLKPNGVFVFDFWYGPSVLYNRPRSVLKVVTTPSGKVFRTSSSTLDTTHHLCIVRFNILRIAQDHHFEEIEEAHPVRFFFPLEIEHFLEISGLRLEALRAFPDFDRQANDDDWNAVAVATAVG
jgi:SAM-dependent methyltransferase